MHTLRLLPVVLLLASAAHASVFPPEAVKWSATMPDEPLDVGKQYRLKVKVEIDGADGYRPYGQSPNAAFIVQVDAPDCIRLISGDPLRPFDSPYEHAVMGFPLERSQGPIKGEAWVDFKLRRKPKPGDVIGLNLCGYIERPIPGAAPRKPNEVEANDIWFVRMRGSILPERRAEMRPSDPMRSSWGGVEGRLQIGDIAEPFELPDMVGDKHHLRDYVGRYYLIVAMYRDHASRFCTGPLFSMHTNYNGFDALGARVIGVSKEDETFEDFKKFVSRMRPHPPRTLFLWDKGGGATRRYDPTTNYLIDLDGRVREIFPGTSLTRCPPKTLMREIEHVMKEDGMEPPKIEMPTTASTDDADGGESATESSGATGGDDGGR